MISTHYVPLYQSICHSEKMADLKSHAARLFYILLLTHADSYGQMTADSRTLWARVWSLWGSVEEIDGLLGDIARVGLVRVYEVSGRRYLLFPDWDKRAGKVGRADRRGPKNCPDPEPCGSGPAACGSSPGGSSPARARAGSDPSQAKPSQSPPTPPVGGKRASRAGSPDWDESTWGPILAEFPMLDTPLVREGYREFLAMRKRKHFGAWCAETLRKNLRVFVDHPPQALIDSLDRSTRGEYRALVEPRSNVAYTPTFDQQAARYPDL